MLALHEGKRCGCGGEGDGVAGRREYCRGVHEPPGLGQGLQGRLLEGRAWAAALLDHTNRKSKTPPAEASGSGLGVPLASLTAVSIRFCAGVVLTSGTAVAGHPSLVPMTPPGQGQ